MGNIPSSSGSHILSFEEWMERMYPHPTSLRSILRACGALDAMYLMYRLGILKIKNSPIAHESAPIRRAMQATVNVEPQPRTVAAPVTQPMENVIAKKKKAAPKVAKPKVEKKTTKAKSAKKKKSTPVVDVKIGAKADDVIAEPEITIEFEKDLPVHTPAPEPEVVDEPIEPEPLVFEEAHIEKKAPDGALLWLDSAELEDEDLRKTKLPLGLDGIRVSFESRDIDDETETLLCVNDSSYRMMLTSPSMNLSRMLQIARVSYGELYVLGRAALGAISGEGYIPADEVARIVRALNESSKTIDLDVRYYSKDATSRSRTPSTIRIHAEHIQ